MKDKPRILFVTAHCPFGQAYGAQLRTLNMARILSRLGEMSMVLFPFAPLEDEWISDTAEEFDLRGVFYFSLRSSRSLGARIRREFDPFSADTEGKRLQSGDEEAFMKLAEGYDLVWFQGVSIPNCLGRREWPCSILDIDDVPSQFHKGRVREISGTWGRLKAARKFAQWKWRETVLEDRFGVVGVCSERDRGYLGGGRRIHVLPNGFDPPEGDPSRDASGNPRIGFIGTMKYGPNRQGMEWFIREVWPLVRSRFPDVRLRIAGSGTESVETMGDPSIDRLGFVKEGDAEIATWALTIVPIRVGGGTRIKIAEAFSRMCPVVSTSQGAYGYKIADGRECLLADSADDFARACVSLLENPSMAEEMAMRAKSLFDRELSWSAVAPAVERAVSACLENNVGAGV